MPAFASDNFSGLTAGTALAGRTASDGSSVWTDHVAGIVGDGVGGVYPAAGTTTAAFCLIDNNRATCACGTVAFDYIPGSGGYNTGVTGSGGVSVVMKAIYGAGTNIIVRMLFNGAAVTMELLEESSFGSYFNHLGAHTFVPAGTCHVVVSFSLGNATMTVTGGASFSQTITCKVFFACLGSIGITGTNPASGGYTATTGLHIANLTASDSTAAATAYVLLPPIDLATHLSTFPIASKVPTGLNVPDPNCGYGVNPSTQFGLSTANQRQFTLALDGPAPVGGFTWTLASVGNVIVGAGGPATSVTIPAGAAAVQFAYVPPAGRLTDVTVVGTNNRGFAEAAGIVVTVRGKLLNSEGDSQSSPSFGGHWVDVNLQNLLPEWAVVGTAIEFSQLSSSNADIDITQRSVLTIDPFHDATRTQEACICLGGTNDIFVGGASAATTFARLQAWVNGRKAAGRKNLFVGTCLDRGSVSTEPAFHISQLDYNARIRAAYGRTGADPTVFVIDFASDPNLGGSGASLNPAYFPDQTHPTGAPAQTLMGSMAAAEILKLPATQNSPVGLAGIGGGGMGGGMAA